MPGANVWWTGGRLPQGEVALAVFGRRQVESVHRVPLLGAAASGAASVVLLPTDFGRFLRRHEDVTLICYNAGELHWLLEDNFRQSNDTQSSAILWAYSGESRLIDVMLLDQHVRRCRGEDSVAASPLSQLAQRRVGMNLPDELEIQEKVAAAWQEMARGLAPDDSVLELVLAAPATVFAVCERLLTDEQNIADAVQASQLPPLVVHPPDPAETEAMMAQFQKAMVKPLSRLAVGNDFSTEPRDTVVEKADLFTPLSFGPLGVGIDVQAAVAVSKPSRPGLQIDPQQLDDVRAKNNLRFRRASQRLQEDSHARPCFRWSVGQGDEKLVTLDNEGLPAFNHEALKGWLRSVADRLCDTNNLPAAIPLTYRGDPSLEPERWEIWAACNRSLLAWRNLWRAARVDRLIDHPDLFRPAYNVMPVFSAPDLIAFRSLGISMFRPKSGSVFIVGNLPLLNLYSLAAVYERRERVPRGRLTGHFLESSDPIGEIAGELYARTTGGGGNPGAEDISENSGVSAAPASFQAAIDRFVKMKEEAPETYASWLGTA